MMRRFSNVLILISAQKRLIINIITPLYKSYSFHLLNIINTGSFFSTWDEGEITYSAVFCQTSLSLFFCGLLVKILPFASA